jgi:hypothetical protein
LKECKILIFSLSHLSVERIYLTACSNVLIAEQISVPWGKFYEFSHYARLNTKKKASDQVSDNYLTESD